MKRTLIGELECAGQMVRAAAAKRVEGAGVILEHVEGACLINGLEKLRILVELRVLACLNELVVGSDGFGDLLTAGPPESFVF